MSGTLAKSAGLIGAATLSSRVLGLVRDQIMTLYFGTGMAADAFAVATRIPTLLRDLFAEGAMSAAFVPTFTRTLARGGRPAAWRLGANVVNGLLAVTAALVLLGVVCAEPLTRAYTNANFATIPGKLALTVQLTRVNLPFLTLIAVAAAFMGMLNALRRFVVPAMAPTTYNVVFIVCTAAGVPAFQALGLPPIMAASMGMLLGGLAQIVSQWPTLRAEGYRHQWVLDPKDPGLREVLALMGPGSLGVAAAQINIFVNTVLATGIAGAAAALGYAFRLMYMPVGIIGVSIATAAIPDLARHAAKGSHGDMRTTLSWGMRLMLVMSVPATVGLMALSIPIVELIFKRGAFGDESVYLTAQSLLFYAPGIVGYSLVKILSPSFYSLQDARTPVIASVATILTNLVLNVTLVRVLGFQGLALGTAIAANVNAGLLFMSLSRRLGGLDGVHIANVFARVAVASAVMAAAAISTESRLHLWWPAEATPARLVRVAGGVTAGVATFAAAAWALRIAEVRESAERLLRRARRATPSP